MTQLRISSQWTPSLGGILQIPGDKSISHRALMLAAIAEGESQISAYLDSDDVIATLNALEQLGVSIRKTQDMLYVKGVGLNGLQSSDRPIDMGNSGTAARLMAGLLAAQKFSSTLTGDDSLITRPMRRIVDPLERMRAKISCSDKGTLPIHITGGQMLVGTNHELAIASAQLKSCLLLAGLYAQGETKIREKMPTRDHTERMLSMFSHPVKYIDGQIVTVQATCLKGTKVKVPGDFSSSAFFILAAVLVANSELTLLDVGINPTRTAMLEIMKMMGAKIQLNNQRDWNGEPVADIHIVSSTLHGIDIPEKFIAIAIDELPAILIAGAVAKGVTRLSGAEELRYKESDRIQSMVAGFIATGIDVEQTADGMIIHGGQFQGGAIDSQYDHRIAMAFAIGGLVSKKPIIIDNCNNISTSFPNFMMLAKACGMRLYEL